jgi:hypothetical protein
VNVIRCSRKELPSYLRESFNGWTILVPSIELRNEARRSVEMMKLDVKIEFERDYKDEID